MSKEPFRVVREVIENYPLPSNPSCQALNSETVWSGYEYPTSMTIESLALQALYEANDRTAEQSLVVEERTRAHLGRIVLPWHKYRSLDMIFV